MYFADDGIAADADLGGDLTAGQAGDDKAAELLNALRIPGRLVDGVVIDGVVMGKRPRMKCRGLFWAADRAKAARNRVLSRAGRLGRESGDATAGMRPRSPSRIPRLSGCQPDVFTPGPLPGAAFKLVERKPSPRRNVA